MQIDPTELSDLIFNELHAHFTKEDIQDLQSISDVMAEKIAEHYQMEAE